MPVASGLIDQSYVSGAYYPVVAVDPANPCTVYSGDTTGNVRRNSSCGTMAFSAYGAAFGADINALAAHPTNQATVLAGTATGTIYRRLDASSAWTAVATVPGSINAIAYQPGSTQVVYAAGTGGVVYKSTDGGSSWSPSATIGPRISSLGVTSANANMLVAGTTEDSDAFYTQFSPTGAIVASTWIGGYGLERAHGVALTPAGQAVVVGQTYATNFPTTAGVPYPTAAGAANGFVARIDPLASPPNTPPTIGDVTDRSVAPGTSTGAIAFTVGDAETAASALTVTGASSNTTLVPAANVVIGGSGAARTVTVTPVAGQSGTTTITLTVSDGALTAADTFLLTVTIPGGLPPTAVGDAYATAFGTVLTVPARGVLDNDTSNGGGPMTAAVVTGPASGSVVLSPSGSFTYTPNPGFSGVDSFTYRAANAAGPGNAATVTILVAGAGAPVPPSSFRLVSIAGTNVVLAWTPPTSGPLPTGYRIEGGVAPGQVLGALPLGLTRAVSFALPTGSFYLRIRSVAGGAVSDASNEILAHVNVPVPPTPPSGLLGLVVGNTVSLAWRNSLSGGAPTSLILEVAGTLSGSLPLGLADTFTFPGVPPGSYTFTLRAVNGSGTSGPSNGVTLAFPGGCTGAPLPPANFLAYAVGSTVSVTWDPASSGPAPTSYVLGATGAVVGSLPVASRSVSGIVGPGSYTLSVSATNPCGASTPTPAQTVTVP